MKLLMVALMGLAVVTSGSAKVRGEIVEYKQGDTALEGYLAFDPAVKGSRPGVLVVPDWMGVTDYAKARADQLAGLGYVAFLADVYGKGVRPRNSQEASAEAAKYYKDVQLFRARVRAGLDYLAHRPETDASRLAAIGYCFGGGGALELARSGAPLKGVVTFHGRLGTPNPADAKNIKAKILVLHGADDPYVKPEEVKAFMDEMRAAGVDWQLVYYSGAVHAFTIKSSGNDPSKGAAYNEAADRRSWVAMEDFFDEIFAR